MELIFWPEAARLLEPGGTVTRGRDHHFTVVSDQPCSVEMDRM